jgi:hypothetical protein
MRSVLSNREVTGLSVSYAGVGAFFGTLLTGVHPMVPFFGGFLMALAGLWVFAEGRSRRFQAARNAQ